MKTNLTIVLVKPFTVSIKKNKRAVNVAVAKLLLKKAFPEATEDGWTIGIGDHRTLARRNDDWIPQSSNVKLKVSK